MSTKPQQPANTLDAAVKALRLYLMEKGNSFDHGPAYEGHGKVLTGVAQAMHLYQGMGYTKLFALGEPPVYALLQRGHREAHLFEPQDPQIRQWLENDEVVKFDDPAMRAYMLQKSGLNEGDVPSAAKPRRFHVNEVDNVFVATADDEE
ncbi:MAG: hypothetical protein EKK69_14195 [Candidatus Competibacteraceae bacterium]|nr:MAG: hypothetical protein EKK69_14195 [Candidatus Competibacteraceae bacterium]